LTTILTHKDPTKITTADLDIILNCLEQIILFEVPMQALLESKLGYLIRQFYDFVHSNRDFKVLDVLTRCAFKKLKKEVCEILFGVTKTIPYENKPISSIAQKSVKKLPQSDAQNPIIIEDETTKKVPEKPKAEKIKHVKKPGTPNVVHLRSLPARKEKKRKEEELKLTELRNRPIIKASANVANDENVHKPPANPRLKERVISDLSKMLLDVIHCLNNALKIEKDKIRE